jgi:hypothetical protein
MFFTFKYDVEVELQYQQNLWKQVNVEVKLDKNGIHFNYIVDNNINEDSKNDRK